MSEVALTIALSRWPCSLGTELYLGPAIGCLVSVTAGAILPRALSTRGQGSGR